MKRKQLIKILALIFVGFILYYGSTHRELTSNVSSSAGADRTSKSILAVGSTALQPLVEQAASQFEDKNAGISIIVQGGGSGAGLTQVSAGSVQIGNSDVFAEQKSGIDASKLSDHKVAVVGIAPVVNKDVDVSNLTTEQLRGIFTGQITNWNQVGGSDLPIVVINRASGSGTRTVFESSILNGAQAVSAQEQDSNGTVQKIVSQTPGAISYLGFGFIDDSLQKLTVDGVSGVSENVANDSWKIWGYEHMYTKGESKRNTKKFIDFFLEDSIQHSIVTKLGYIPLDVMQVSKDAQGKVSAK